MMDSLLKLLCCPYCGTKVSVKSPVENVQGKTYGLLECGCDEYPIIAGIPVIKKGPIGANKKKHKFINNLIKERNYSDALFSMLFDKPTPNKPNVSLKNPISIVNKVSNKFQRTDHSSNQVWLDKTKTLIENKDGQVTACDLLDVYFNRPDKSWGSAYDYFAYRFGQPRHLVALSLAQLIRSPTKPVLDLGCGFGHIARDLIPRSNNQAVIGVDNNFFTLYVAKYWVSPESDYVYCDGDLTLPFKENTFSDLMCINSFHTFGNKVTCMNEAKRVTSKDGVIVLAGLRHTGYGAITPNPLLSIEEYVELVGGMKNVVIADNNVLDRYLDKLGPNLEKVNDIAELNKEPFITIIASANGEVFSNYGSFDNWPHAEGAVSFNPLYHVSDSSDQDTITLVREFPSEEYEEENQECKRYMPDRISISADLYNSKEYDKTSEEIESLIKQCVLLGLPEKYY